MERKPEEEPISGKNIGKAEVEDSRGTNQDLEESDYVTCAHCCQIQCRFCVPGYIRLVMDMKEFSKTLAEDIELCTLCEHQLCPGSGLVVLTKCRDCGHEVCEKCHRAIDSAGEEWSTCCVCHDECTQAQIWKQKK